MSTRRSNADAAEARASRLNKVLAAGMKTTAPTACGSYGDDNVYVVYIKIGGGYNDSKTWAIEYKNKFYPEAWGGDILLPGINGNPEIMEKIGPNDKMFVQKVKDVLDKFYEGWGGKNLEVKNALENISDEFKFK